MHGVRQPELDDDLKIRAVVARLRGVLGDTVDDDVLEQRVREAFDAWQHAKVRDFIPLLTERRVLEDLRR